MRGLVFRAGQAVAVETLPDPAPGPGEVVIAVRASGICHTDMEILRGNYGAAAFPLVPGHEFAGEVVALGSGVASVAVGDRVVVDPNIGCGVCPACLRGRVNLCQRLRACGVTRNGGFAAFCAVPADRLVAAGDLDWPVAALAEPLGCVLNGLSPMAGRDCGRALVFGAGPIGLLMALALRWTKGAEVTVVDLSPDRLALAGRFGFSAVAAGSDALAGMARSMDLVVDATGVPAVADGLLGYACDGGAALLFGVCPQSARIEVSPFEMFRRQLSLFGTHSLNHDMRAAMPLLAAHGAEAARIVSHRMDLDGIAAAFRQGVPAGALKVQLGT
jgi:2-desacetyl-2-hydroxyethyl bacteriochlorophyllide A dehydrogenase